MRVEDLKNLINRNESTVVEWKPSLSQMKEIINTISAFANTEGGKVFVGVSKAGELLGTQIGKGTIENLTNQISQHTDPKVHPRITTKKMEDREIIIIDVKESADHLVLAFGQPHKRVGRSTVRMSKDEYERLILEKHKDKIQFDSQMCEGAQLKDIDKSKVKWFLQRAKEERDFDVSPNISAKEAVERMGLVKDNGLTNTAVLFFARNPQRFILHSRIRCARFKGTDGLDYIDMNVLDGTVIELRQKALKFIMQHTKHAVFFDANRRYDRWEYPLRALEEVLSNALAHRDYYSNAEIQLSIYDDRIEVWNPGTLPKPLTPQKLKKKHRSIPRNSLLADKLFLIKYIEQWGRGTNRIMEWMKEENLPEPEFQNIAGGFEVTLIGPGRSFEREIEKQKLHELDLNQRQKKAIEYIKKSGRITKGEYMQINKISHKTAYEELNKMVGKNIIVRQGKGRATVYVFK